MDCPQAGRPLQTIAGGLPRQRNLRNLRRSARLALARIPLEHEQMSAEETQRHVERYLHSNIPLSAAMGVQVKVATPEHVHLSAPLALNINHQQTVFGGSGVVLATLSAWTLLHLRLEQAGVDAQLVIQRSAMEYEKPIPGDFDAVCKFADDPAWQRFRTTLERRGRARLSLRAYLLYAVHEMGAFVGDFVALRTE
jgi:thioesterase domain-containing protein